MLSLQSRSGGGGGRSGGRRGGGRRDGGARREGGAAAAAAGGEEGESKAAAGGHPLDRAGGGGSSSGPIRHERRRGGGGDRDRAPRDSRDNAPYARSERDSGSSGQWARGAELVSSSSSVAKLIGDTVRLSNLNPDMSEDDLRYVFDKIGTIKNITIHYNSLGKSVGTAGENARSFERSQTNEFSSSSLEQSQPTGQAFFSHSFHFLRVILCSSIASQRFSSAATLRLLSL